ncbi:Primosomal protein N' [compost metagenome]
MLRAEAHKPGQAEGFLDEACSAAERIVAEQGLQGIELLGPVPAPMERRAGRFRAQLLLQANARAPLHRLISAWLLVLEQMPAGRQVRWSLDVDPVDLY